MIKKNRLTKMKINLKTVITIFMFFLSGNSIAHDNPGKLKNPIDDTPRELTFAIELNSGLRDSKNIVNPYYTGSIRLYMELSYLNNFARVAPFVGGAFENPGGSFEAGLRNDFKLFRIESKKLPLVEFRAGLSYYYSFYNKVNATGVDVKVDMMDFVFLSIRYNKNLDNSEYTIMPGIGIYF